MTSPTFNILNEYIIGNFVVKHYGPELKSDDELKDLNLFENNNKDILFIEWPQIIKMNRTVIKIYFEYEIIIKIDFKNLKLNDFQKISKN